jgi:NADH-quinone oxidoreductase subunit A
MLFDFGSVLALLTIAVLFVFVTLVFSWIVRPSKPSPEKASTYECGEQPIGSSWIKFNLRFYVIALIFIIFEVEVLVLFPWALIYKQLSWLGFVEMLIFVGILLLALAYLWKQGDLDWVKPNLKHRDTEDTENS